MAKTRREIEKEKLLWGMRKVKFDAIFSIIKDLGAIISLTGIITTMLANIGLATFDTLHPRIQNKMALSSINTYKKGNILNSSEIKEYISPSSLKKRLRSSLVTNKNSNRIFGLFNIILLSLTGIFVVTLILSQKYSRRM